MEMYCYPYDYNNTVRCQNLHSQAENTLYLLLYFFQFHEKRVSVTELDMLTQTPTKMSLCVCVCVSQNGPCVL